jgi:hypothetical protein
LRQIQGESTQIQNPWRQLSCGKAYEQKPWDERNPTKDSPIEWKKTKVLQQCAAQGKQKG